MHHIGLVLLVCGLTLAACKGDDKVSAEKVCEHVAPMGEVTTAKCLKDLKSVEKDIKDMDKEHGAERFDAMTKCMVTAKTKSEVKACIPLREIRQYRNESEVDIKAIFDLPAASE